MNVIKIGLLGILSTFLFLSSCTNDTCISGEGDSVNIELNMDDFSGINMATSANVTIIQGSSQKVIATGNANIIDRVTTNVNNGVWNIDLKDECYNNYDLKFYVIMPNLHTVNISGSGDVVIGDFINQGDLGIDISGSGDVSMDGFISLGDLNINISGSGNVESVGDASMFQILDIQIPGSGNYNGFPIYLKECYVDISGSGNCYVRVQSKLNVDISGSGNVNYKGYPFITTHITGSGSVENWN